LRLLLVMLVCALLLAGAPANADEIVLDARAGALIVETRVNAQPVRLIVDTRLPDIALFNPGAAARLGLRRVPLVSAGVGLDGDLVLKGKITRPESVFANGESRRVLAGLFGVDAAAEADGAIGPGALPYDLVRLRLGASSPTASERRILLDSADSWSWKDRVGATSVNVMFDVARPQTLSARRLTEKAVAAGLFAPRGETRPVVFMLGIQMRVRKWRRSRGSSSRGCLWARSSDTRTAR
jgi:hypothetical protein